MEILHKKGTVTVTVVIILLFITIAGLCLKLENHSSTAQLQSDIGKDFLDAGLVILNPPENQRVTLAAVGDIMMHEGQVWSGYDDFTQLYDYKYFFEDIKQEIYSADIAMANLETTLGGKEQKFTGYPKFNSPDELADALKDTGFDVIFTSNNHCLDRGENGLFRSLKILKEKGLSPVGTNDSFENRDTVLVKEVNGIKLAFLAYTYGTNGICVPDEKPYMVNIIEEQVILSDLEKARELADAVVVYLHFGQEYERTPSRQQKNLAHLLLSKGADVIIGSHPHVIQPGEWVEVSNSDDISTKKYSAYSLGNFISAQRFPYTEEGLILKITLEKDAVSGRIATKDVEEIPTWVEKFKSKGKMRYVVRLGKIPAKKL